MKKRIVWVVIAIILLLTAGYVYQSVPTDGEIKTVNMIGNNGESIGTIQLSETRAGVLFNLDLSGLTADGEHAIHVHEKGDCMPLETFKNAGGHFNPDTKKHGMRHPEGHHAGDMPNLKPDDEGKIKTVFVNLKVTLKDTMKKRHSVFDEDGSAIVIHAGADDHMSQPSGAAGARIACGVIN